MELTEETQSRKKHFLCLVLLVSNEICHFEITEQTVENDQKFSPEEGKISYFPKETNSVRMSPQAAKGKCRGHGIPFTKLANFEIGPLERSLIVPKVK